MDQENIFEIEFPPQGLDVMHALSEQPPGTTPRGVNVRLNEGLTTRSRGGSRTGISRYVPGLIPGGGLVQDLTSVVTTDPDDPMTFEFTQYQWPDWTWPWIDFGWSWPGGWAWEGMWPGQGLGRGGYTPAVGGYQSSQGSVDAFANQRFIIAGRAGSVGNGGADYNQNLPIVRTALGTAQGAGVSSLTIPAITLNNNDILIMLVVRNSANGGSNFAGFTATHAGSVLNSAISVGGPAIVVPANAFGAAVLYLNEPAGLSGDIVVSDQNAPLGTADMAIIAVKYSGLTGGVDASDFGTGSDGSPTGTTIATTTTDAVVGFIATAGPKGDANGTWQNAFTAGQREGTNDGADPNGNATVYEGYQIAAAGNFTAATLTGAVRDWIAITVGFK